MKEKNLDFEKINVPHDREAKIRKDLFKKSGVLTVPVIKIGERYIGESEEIIKFIDEKYS